MYALSDNIIVQGQECRDLGGYKPHLPITKTHRGYVITLTLLDRGYPSVSRHLMKQEADAGSWRLSPAIIIEQANRPGLDGQALSKSVRAEAGQDG